MTSISTIPIRVAKSDKEYAQIGIHKHYRDLQLLHCQVQEPSQLRRHASEFPAEDQCIDKPRQRPADALCPSVCPSDTPSH